MQRSSWILSLMLGQLFSYTGAGRPRPPPTVHLEKRRSCLYYRSGVRRVDSRVLDIAIATSKSRSRGAARAQVSMTLLFWVSAGERTATFAWKRPFVRKCQRKHNFTGAIAL